MNTMDVQGQKTMRDRMRHFFYLVKSKDKTTQAKHEKAMVPSDLLTRVADEYRCDSDMYII